MSVVGVGFSVLAIAVAGLYLVALMRASRELAALIPLTRTALEVPLAVVMPARNEEQRIGATLDALLADSSAHLVVTVFDDGSEDGTAAVVEERARTDARVRLIRAGTDATAHALQPGVFGKPHALAQATKLVAASVPDAKLLLFLDADVHVDNGVLGGLVTALEATGADALSGTPSLVLGTAIEQALVPAFVSLVGERHRPRRVHDDARPDAFLNGQCILVRADALERVGGFESVQRTVLEDVALARRLKRDGARLRLADLRGHVSTRMYTSWAEIRDGFAKNARQVLGGTVACFRLAALGLLLAWLPWVALGVAIARGETNFVVVTATAHGVIFACGARVRVMLGGAVWPVLLLPAVWTGVAWVLVRAATGAKVRWRGRLYDDDGSDAESAVLPPERGSD